MSTEDTALTKPVAWRIALNCICVLALLALLQAGFHYLYLRYDLFSMVNELYLQCGVPLLLGGFILLLLWRDLGRVGNHAGQFLRFLVFVIAAMVLMNVTFGLRHAMLRVVHLPSVETSNIAEIQSADYIFVDSVLLRRDDVGAAWDSFISGGRNRAEKTVLYQICALDNVLNVCIGSRTDGDDYKMLNELPMRNLCLKNVKPSSGLQEYLLVGKTCRNAVFVQRTQDSRLTVLELAAPEDLERGEAAWWLIPLLMFFLFAIVWIVCLFADFVDGGPHPLVRCYDFVCNKNNFITWALPATWVIGFLYELFQGYNPSSSNLQLLIDCGAVFNPFGLDHFQYWRILTYGFLHDGFEHLASNTLFFYFLCLYRPSIDGMEEKSRLKRVLLVYFVGMMVAGLWCAMSDLVVLVGASGGVFALHGSLLARYLFLDKSARKALNGEYTFLFIIMILNILFSLSPGVSLAGHVSGLVAGFLLEVGLEWYARYREECC